MDNPMKSTDIYEHLMHSVRDKVKSTSSSYNQTTLGSSAPQYSQVVLPDTFPFPHLGQSITRGASGIALIKLELAPVSV